MAAISQKPQDDQRSSSKQHLAACDVYNDWMHLMIPIQQQLAACD